MATTTRRVLRQGVAEKMGDYQPITTTALGLSTTLISTDFKDLPGGNDDDAFLGFYDYITSGNNDNESRRASLFTESSNTLTLARAHTNAVANAVSLVVHRHNPADYHIAIQQAISDLARHLYSPIKDETLVVDQLLANGDFESTIVAGAHPSWTNVGAGITVTAETSILMHGLQSAKVVAASVIGQMTQTPVINIREITGKSAKYKMWVYATAGSVARIRLDWDGTSFDNSDYHTGSDQWELLSISASVPSDATQVKVICEVAISGTGYFDAGWLAIQPVYRYTLPTSFIGGINYISQQADEFVPDGRYHALNGDATEGRRLRLEGRGILTNPATDTATIEIGEPQVSILVAQAARNLNLILARRSAGQQQERYIEDAKRFENEVSDKLGSLRPTRMGAQEMKGSHHIDTDASGRYLVLDGSRA